MLAQRPKMHNTDEFMPSFRKQTPNNVTMHSMAVKTSFKAPSPLYQYNLEALKTKVVSLLCSGFRSGNPSARFFVKRNPGDECA